MMNSEEATEQHEEPWWIGITQIGDDYVSATVDAPSEEQAIAEVSRTIAGNEGTDEFEVKRVRGPFPRSPGEANFEVRPAGCGGCGLQLWCGNHAPTPNHTWFTRVKETEDDVVWKCIQCTTRTVKPQ